MGIYEDLKRTFRGKEVPDELSSLTDFVDDEEPNFCGSFELEAMAPSALKALFKNKPELADYFYPFGVDGVGSVFALWAYKNQDPSLCPVVYLACEGAGSRVIAKDLTDFLRILGCNRDWEPFDKEFMEPDQETSTANRTYRRWLKLQMRLDRAEDPQDLADLGVKAHPDFRTWLKERLESPGPSS